MCLFCALCLRSLQTACTLSNADNPALLIMITNTQNDRLLHVAEAAKLASVSQRTIFNWLESKAVSCIKMGRVIRFDRQTFMGELKAFSTPVAGRR